MFYCPGAKEKQQQQQQQQSQCLLGPLAFREFPAENTPAREDGSGLTPPDRLFGRREGYGRSAVGCPGVPLLRESRSASEPSLIRFSHVRLNYAAVPGPEDTGGPKPTPPKDEHVDEPMMTTSSRSAKSHSVVRALMSLSGMVGSGMA
ncbi:hypothetical protein EYF80_053825 [Liparis tanakae]|uniref:Uncharacterized protein n=1 Tax=Liparis tanakae TaxID=230148 RepID=A0A4Z2F4C8_9TELE|nr:hypothetical protein EYF80_053825 [Liparis tanakae]